MRSTSSFSPPKWLTTSILHFCIHSSFSFSLEKKMPFPKTRKYWLCAVKSACERIWKHIIQTLSLSLCYCGQTNFSSAHKWEFRVALCSIPHCAKIGTAVHFQTLCAAARLNQLQPQEAARLSEWVMEKKIDNTHGAGARHRQSDRQTLLQRAMRCSGYYMRVPLDSFVAKAALAREISLFWLKEFLSRFAQRGFGQAR